MKILVLLAHPDEGSFNHAIFETAVAVLKKKGHTVLAHDLYREKFDPVIPASEITGETSDPLVKRYCEEIASADGIVIVHPNWWGQPPAILKGWEDRVLRAGVAYRFKEGDNGEGVPIGLLKARTAVVLNTSNTPEKREKEVFGDPLESFWKKCVFQFCGVRNIVRRNYGVVCTSSPAEREGWLSDAAAVVENCFTEAG